MADQQQEGAYNSLIYTIEGKSTMFDDFKTAPKPPRSDTKKREEVIVPVKLPKAPVAVETSTERASLPQAHSTSKKRLTRTFSFHRQKPGSEKPDAASKTPAA